MKPSVTVSLAQKSKRAQRKEKHTSWLVLLIAVEAFQLLHDRRNNFHIKVETLCIQVPTGGTVWRWEEGWRMRLPTSSNTSHMQPVLLSSSTTFRQTCKQEFTHAALDKYPAKTRTAVHVAKGLYWLTKKIMSSRWHVQKRRKKEKKMWEISLKMENAWFVHSFGPLLPYFKSSGPDCCD